MRICLLSRAPTKSAASAFERSMAPGGSSGTNRRGVAGVVGGVGAPPEARVEGRGGGVGGYEWEWKIAGKRRSTCQEKKEW